MEKNKRGQKKPTKSSLPQNIKITPKQYSKNPLLIPETGLEKKTSKNKKVNVKITPPPPPKTKSPPKSDE
ncbi:MAG: hypothetical protein JEZ02_20485 [Desulfatibacillum sp.]|nr:hypothetical protein [Desulfatibacillum sp.]